jgi:hypothetical protein
VPRQVRKARYRDLLPDLGEDGESSRQRLRVASQLAVVGRAIEGEIELDGPERLEARVLPEAVHLEARGRVALVVDDALPPLVGEGGGAEQDISHEIERSRAVLLEF